MEIRFDDTTTQALMTGMAASATTITDVRVKGESMGSGGAVGGMPTRRYRLTTDYSYLDGGSGSSAGAGKARVVEDYWVSDRLSGVIDPLEQVGRALGGRGGFGASPFAAVGGTSLGALLEKRASEQRRLFQGMPARTVPTTTDVWPGGGHTETRTTTEIADVVRGDVDPALFRVPEGYTRFDMRQLLNVSAQLKGALRGRANSAAANATDSSSMLGAAKEGAEAGAEEGLREGARGRARPRAARSAASSAVAPNGGAGGSWPTAQRRVTRAPPRRGRSPTRRRGSSRRACRGRARCGAARWTR